jgi:hypothetical protein
MLNIKSIARNVMYRAIHSMCIICGIKGYHLLITSV